HAGIIARADLERWLTGTTPGYPTYVQISYSHMYILTEDISQTPQDDPDDWPRSTFFKKGGK
ncbi:hypothetical protein FRC06_004098, partial [Ceratobasidium sp. 370]